MICRDPAHTQHKGCSAAAAAAPLQVRQGFHRARAESWPQVGLKCKQTAWLVCQAFMHANRLCSEPSSSLTMSSATSCSPPGSVPLLYRSSTEFSSDASTPAEGQASYAITLPAFSRISGSYSTARTKADTCAADESMRGRSQDRRQTAGVAVLDPQANNQSRMHSLHAHPVCCLCVLCWRQPTCACCHSCGVASCSCPVASTAPTTTPPGTHSSQRMSRRLMGS